MPAGSTYTPIYSTTLSSAVADYTFSSIPGTYTDLIVIINGGTSSSGQSIGMRFNGDSGNNYYSVDMWGNGTSPSFSRLASTSFIRVVGRGIGTDSSLIDNSVTHIQSYSSSSLKKAVINRSTVSGGVTASGGKWNSASAITSITFFGEGPSNLITGTTIALYGIKAA